MKKILVAQKYWNIAAPLLKHHHLQPVAVKDWGADHLLKNATDASGMIVVTQPITKKIITGLPQLKIIARAGIGYDNVDTNTASQYNVWVSNTPGANAHTVAENDVADLLIMSKHLFSTSNQMRGQKSISNYPRHALFGKTVGVVGFGNIARAIIQILHGLGVKIVIWNHRKHQTKYGKFVDWSTLIKESDYLTLNVPAVPRMIHCINKKALHDMKSSAFLINFGRGSLINQADLVSALQQHEIAGAGLDVFEKEPLSKSSKLFQLPNVFLTPHVGGTTVESTQKMGTMATQNVISTLSKNHPVNPVNHF